MIAFMDMLSLIKQNIIAPIIFLNIKERDILEGKLFINSFVKLFLRQKPIQNV